MKKFFMDLFDEKSTISSMRFMSITSLFIGGVIAAIGLYKCDDLMGISLLVGVFVSAAFTGKVLQKNIEEKAEAKAAEETEETPK